MMAAVAAAPLAAMMCSGSALGQVGRAAIQPLDQSAAPPGRSGLNSWSASVFVNTTDNFNRIEGGDFQRLFLDENGTPLTELVLLPAPGGGFFIANQTVEDTVPIEPISKAFATVTLDGLSVVDRPTARAIVRGRVRVGAYFNDDNVSDVFADEINSNVPQEAIDGGFEPSIGNLNFRQAFVDPNISGAADVDIIGDILGLETGGFVIEQARIQGSQLQAQQPGQDLNEIILGGVFVSPVLRLSFPRAQEYELRYRNSSVFIINEFQANEDVAVGPSFNDSVSNEVSSVYRTGELIPNLKLEFEAFARQLDEDGSDTDPSQELEQLSVSTGVEVPITSTFSLRGVIGYDDISTTADASPILDPVTNEPIFGSRTEDFSSTYYSVGFEYRPTRRARVTLGVGERFGGSLLEATINLPITSRISFNANANRTLTTDQQAVQDELAFFNVQALQFVDNLRQSNEQLSERSLGSGTVAPIRGISAAARTNNFGILPRSQYLARLTAAYPRTTVSVGANVVTLDNRNEDVPGVRPAQNDQFVGFSSISRRVSRRFTVTASGTALYLPAPDRDPIPGAPPVAFGSDILDQFYSLQFNYTISRDWGLAFGYTHLRRNIDGPTTLQPSFFGGRFFEYRENQLQGGVQFVF